MTKSEIKSMSIESRMQLMNELWASICEDEAAGKEVISPGWHGEILKQRMSNPSSEPSISLEEAEKRLRGAIHESRNTAGGL